MSEISKVVDFNHYEKAKRSRDIIKIPFNNHHSEVDLQKERRKMDNEKLLEKYMDKIDADQRDLKSDMRASEERLHNHTLEMEKRVEANIAKSVESLQDFQKEVGSRFDRMEDKIDNNQKFMWGILYSVIGMCVAIIGTCVATVVAVWLK